MGAASSLQNAGVGLLVIIPGARYARRGDVLNQAKMLLMIAAAYGEELNMERVKELAALVGGAFACRAVARQLVAFVPALGWAVKAAIGYTGTQAAGRRDRILRRRPELGQADRCRGFRPRQ